LEQLKVLSSLERAGLLSKLESSGLTLRFIEENKLLSKADDLGVLPALSDRYLLHQTAIALPRYLLQNM
jgi:hypothetical protein